MDRRAFLLATSGLAAGLPAFAFQDKAPKGQVKIVSSFPRTGYAQGQTDTIVNGIRLAIKEHKGIVAGYRIEYEDLDDATALRGTWEAAAEERNARRAIQDDEVVAFLGPYNSGAAKVSMPILNEAGLLQISPLASWPGLTKKLPGDKSGEPDIYRPSKKITFCRVCPTDDSQGPLGAEFAASEIKAKSVFILDDGEIYGQGIARGFKAGCEESKIRVLGHEHIDLAQVDFTALMAKIKALGPDLVYFGGTTQSRAPDIAKALAKAGPRCPLMVPDGCYEQAFLEATGAETFDKLTCYVTIGGCDPVRLVGSGAAFATAYKAEYGSAPEAYAVYGYEAAKVVLAGIEKAGSNDREAIRKAVIATKDFDKGALPKWSFDANGDTTRQDLTVSKVAGGKFVPVRSVVRKAPVAKE